ncbi:BQ2448_6456 [Microbotryum intermedium]|uniref:leucyl aminopeptidase n=1 Tax=Microbotryum intermedium TaxID=269621 RepID=A0A238FQ65_9BASI|nr:BQ2448_6456 [Microbotryum intermedium]
MSSSAVYIAVSGGQPVSSAAAQAVDKEVLAKLWQVSGTKDKAGEARTFFGVGGDKTVIAVSTGKTQDKKGGASGENALKELSRRNVSIAYSSGVVNLAGVAVNSVKAINGKQIAIDPLHSPHSAAVGATLASFAFNLKTTTAAKKQLEPIQIDVLGNPTESQLETESEKYGKPLTWETGKIYGEAQNWARYLKELPANLCTPTRFCEMAEEKFKGLKNVDVQVHDLKWAEEKKMGSFISVSRGSDEPLRFLEIHYKGGKADEKPIVLVGKGVTFDTGGISIKPATSMSDMRADMGGAATTTATMWAIAKLELPINVVLCCPLTENMPSGKATKPGDCITASNGVTLAIENTDAEGRLILADALYYASSTFKPSVVIDVATLTGAMMIALGNQFSGIFSNSDSLFSQLDVAAASEKDRVWRMPLDEGYLEQINTTNMDLNNTGGRLAGSATAAIFLKRFVDGLIVDGSDAEEGAEGGTDGGRGEPGSLIKWAHIDIAGTMDLAKGDGGYERAGMSGKITRTLIEFARRYKP